MKKIFTLLMSAVMLTGASSMYARESVALKSGTKNESTRDYRAHAMENFKSEIAKLAKNGAAGKAAAKTDTEASNMPITDPTGVTRHYKVQATSYFTYFGYLFDMTFGGLVGTVVYDESQHEVYLQNPITYLYIESYIKGTYSDTALTFQTPQPLYYDSDSDATYYLHRMVKDFENSTEDTVYYLVDDSEPIVFDVAEDGTLTFDRDGNDVIIGLASEDGSWTYLGDHNVTMTPFDKEELKLSDMPEDFSDHLEKWFIRSDNATSVVRVAEYDNKFYIMGLNKDYDDRLVVGDINGDTVTFPSEQLVGRDYYYNYWQIFSGLKPDQYDDIDFGLTDIYLPLENATFKYNASEKTLTLESGASMGVIGGNLDEYGFDEIYASYDNAKIERVPDNISPKPQAPNNIRLSKGATTSMIYFTHDGINVEGWPLEEDNLYFRIYLDNELFTFTPDVYPGVSEPLTDIGFNQIIYDESNLCDVYNGQDGDSRYVFFYKVYTNPGVQTVYKDGDAEYCSKIMYANSSSVDEAFSDKAVVSECFTDLNGCAVQNPTAGVYIKTTVYDDGSRKVSKVLLNK